MHKLCKFVTALLVTPLSFTPHPFSSIPLCQVLQDYVNLIDDTELKISLAQKYKCHDVIINVRHQINTYYTVL